MIESPKSDVQIKGPSTKVDTLLKQIDLQKKRQVDLRKSLSQSSALLDEKEKGQYNLIEENSLFKDDLHVKRTQLQRTISKLSQVTDMFNKQNERIKKTQECVRELIGFTKMINDHFKCLYSAVQNSLNDNYIQEIFFPVEIAFNVEKQILAKRMRDLPSSKLKNDYKTVDKIFSSIEQIRNYKSNLAVPIFQTFHNGTENSDSDIDNNSNPSRSFTLSPLRLNLNHLKSSSRKHNTSRKLSARSHVSEHLDFSDSYTLPDELGNFKINGEPQKLMLKHLRQLFQKIEKEGNDDNLSSIWVESEKKALEILSTISPLNQEKHKITSSLDELNLEIEKFQSLRRTAKQELADMKADLGTKKKILDDLNFDILRTKKEIELVNTSIFEIEAERDKLDSKTTFLASKLASVNATKDELLESTNLSNHTDLEHVEKDLRMRLANVKIERQSIGIEEDAINKRVVLLQKELEEAEDQLEQAKLLLKERVNRLKELKENVESQKLMAMKNRRERHKVDTEIAYLEGEREVFQVGLYVILGER